METIISYLFILFSFIIIINQLHINPNISAAINVIQPYIIQKVVFSSNPGAVSSIIDNMIQNTTTVIIKLLINSQ